jgi:shikimate kinase
MGSGKSTVGRLLARRLGYRFVDVDERIESRAGMSIREIFAAEGEEAFRRLESETLEDLAGEERIVAAAGGGAPVPEFVAGAAASLDLEVSFEEFLRRTGSDPARPLLQRGTGELRSLYEQRRPVYESLGRRIPTEGRTPEEIVEEILRVLGRSR